MSPETNAVMTESLPDVRMPKTGEAVTPASAPAEAVAQPDSRNWYAIQVMGGREEITARLCQKFLREDEEELFVPRYVRKKKLGGEWKKVEAVLFTGYLFAVTDQVEDLFFRLKGLPELTKILRGEDVFIPLQTEEIKFLKQFGREEHVVEMSFGYKEGDRVVITEGPLSDFQGKILKIDRHKRIAIIEVDFFSRVTKVKVGLEVVDGVGKGFAERGEVLS